MNTFTNAIAAFAIFAAQANAFWGTAHLLVARRAQTILSEQYPSTYAAALTDLAVLKKDQPSLVTEGSNPFTECATFADDIKGKGYSFQSNWHYINLPYLDEAGTTLDDFSFVQPTTDVVSAMNDFTKFLKGEMTVSQSAYLQQVAAKLPKEADQRSFAIRMLIHYVGDLHQPLHSTARVDHMYPSGDRGGNSETIPSKSGVSNLHFVWDSVVYKYTGKPVLPLNSSDFSWYTTESEKLSSSYPVLSTEIKEGDFNAWAQESFEISEKEVYPDFVEGKDPDQAYIDQALPLIEKHMMKAGARLAALMVYIYGSSSYEAASFLN